MSVVLLYYFLTEFNQVDKTSQTIVCDEILEDIEGVEELKESLPDHQPRFVVYTCKLSHNDGRSSYPMCFIFYSPRFNWYYVPSIVLRLL